MLSMFYSYILQAFFHVILWLPERKTGCILYIRVLKEGCLTSRFVGCDNKVASIVGDLLLQFNHK